ncbi:triose-phosphate isomerase [Pelagibacterium xiamenense]|uniref:triose-phosphate isomerase n=1 Tax=Pelagibacterium xiamenense TaxID=2901140 RepID=UPI001E543A11|nr:triose-phosphate isomerase [Pelagibacterium xiamenense]MCD7060943.1 triose-phosphate isomerase [Pelagibacterium xiamenense]
MGTGLRPLIAGNWKMNGAGAALEQIARLNTLLEEAGEVAADVLLCPPATLVHRAANLAEGSVIAIGGQDCHAQASGAHTGDISAPMLVDAGARYVILGHSERRTDHGETSAAVRDKAVAALVAGLTPIICVGETQAQRDAGAANQVVAEQIADSMPLYEDASQTIVAYEPVWAIGTGKTATADDIAAMHTHIRDLLVKKYGSAGEQARILYGGSVKPSNAAEILRTPNVNGALVGGASLLADDFFSIIVAA